MYLYTKDEVIDGIVSAENSKLSSTPSNTKSTNTSVSSIQESSFVTSSATCLRKTYDGYFSTLNDVISRESSAMDGTRMAAKLDNTVVTVQNDDDDADDGSNGGSNSGNDVMKNRDTMSKVHVTQGDGRKDSTRMVERGTTSKVHHTTQGHGRKDGTSIAL